jgi:hypothetical protein
LIHRTVSFAHDLARKPVSTFRDRALSFAHGLIRKPAATFRHHARAEKKCAASPGGTFLILLQGFALSTRGSVSALADSNSPQQRILDFKGKTVGS